MARNFLYVRVLLPIVDVVIRQDQEFVRSTRGLWRDNVITINDEVWVGKKSINVEVGHRALSPDGLNF